MNFSQIYTYLQGKQAIPETKSLTYEKWIDFTDDLEFLVRSSTNYPYLYNQRPLLLVFGTGAST